jgi:hypothetical protein
MVAALLLLLLLLLLMVVVVVVVYWHWWLVGDAAVTACRWYHTQEPPLHQLHGTITTA